MLAYKLTGTTGRPTSAGTGQPSLVPPLPGGNPQLNGHLREPTVSPPGSRTLACRLGVARLPTDTGWRHVLALSCCGGIGFTVSLFISDFSFTDMALVTSAKLGVFIGSAVAGLVGYALLRSTPAPDQENVGAGLENSKGSSS